MALLTFITLGSRLKNHFVCTVILPDAFFVIFHNVTCTLITSQRAGKQVPAKTDS
jgi:hypothetical protein